MKKKKAEGRGREEDCWEEKKKEAGEGEILEGGKGGKTLFCIRKGEQKVLFFHSVLCAMFSLFVPPRSSMSLNPNLRMSFGSLLSFRPS